MQIDIDPAEIELDHRGPWVVAWRGVIATIPDADMQSANRTAGRLYREQERDEALFDEARRAAGVRAIRARLSEMSAHERLRLSQPEATSPMHDQEQRTMDRPTR